MPKRKKVPLRRTFDSSQDIPHELSQTSNADGFKEGALVFLSLQNFMTYDNVSVKAGPYLNLCLAPNGSGKSALVCAIIIGLGGDASTTGRATRMHEYIKYGCDFAQISIVLFNPHGTNHVVSRKLVTGRTKECTSEWVLNNRPSSQREVREFVSTLNIRVDNLCQFLPQERVVEFARMNSKQLLENTQKAIGDANMFENHSKLVELSKSIKTQEVQKGELVKQLETESSILKRVEEEVKRAEEKKKYQDQIDLLQKKKPWIEFEQARLEYVSVKQQVDVQDKNLKKLQSKHEPLREQVQKAVKATKTLQTKSAEYEKRIQEQQKVVAGVAKECEQLSDENSASFRKFLDKKQLEDARLKDIKAMQEEIKVLEMKIRGLSSTDHLVPKIEKLSRDIAQLKKKASGFKGKNEDLKEKIDGLRNQKKDLSSKLSVIEDVYKKRLQRLRRINPNAHTAAEWLEQNKHLFQGNVYPPIMTQINVSDKKWVKYVETVIPSRDLVAFVFEDIGDLKTFKECLYKKTSLNVGLVMAPSRREFEPKVSMNRLKRCGFTHFVRDVFTAPDPVMAFLCENFRVHEIPISLTDVSAKIPEDGLGLVRYLCGDISCSMSVSKYDGETVTVMSDLPMPRQLDITLDESLCSQIKSEISECDSSINAHEAQIAVNNSLAEEQESQIPKLVRERADLLDCINEKDKLSTQIQVKKDRIKSRQASAVDLAEAKRQMMEGAESTFQRKVAKIQKIVQENEKLVKLFYYRSKIILDLELTDRSKAKAQRSLEEANKEFESLEQQLQILKEKREKLKKEAQAKRAAAQQLSGFEQIDDKMLRKFERLPDTIEDINAKIRHLSLRVDNLDSSYDGNAVRDFNKRQQVIKKKQDELHNISADLEVKNKDLRDLKQLWMPKLQSLIENINQNFGSFMARLGCAGEVSLGFGDDENDFAQYGIVIKVKFRDAEALQELSSFHQSGGEKSVATMIYMIALQELTKVPFRCVDEINQGMDTSNERKVFEFIVETADRNSSQYFLLSPKLLKDLNYTPKMQLHVIMNGPYIDVTQFF